MPRSVTRSLLTDAAVAFGLLTVTIGPGLVMGFVTVTKPGVATSFLERGGLPAGAQWWVLSGLVVAGLLIRQRNPLVALALVGVGTVGHLTMQEKFQLLDLALPLTLYAVASVARRRRFALVALALTMACTYFAMLANRVGFEQAQQDAIVAKKAQLAETADEQGRIVKSAAPPASVFSAQGLVTVSESVLEMWLLQIAAYAVGDAMRSRRAHLAAVEQRTVAQARQERQRAALAVAAERARITRELHDVVAHGMSVMVVQAQGAAAALDRHPERAATALQHVIEVGRSSLAEMRRMLAAGRTDPAADPRLTPLPGIGSVPGLVDQLRSAGLRVELEIEGEPGAVPPAVDLSTYRIVQEGLTNALKHAGPAASVKVQINFDAHWVRLEVSDDGHGLAEGADGRGNGLRGIAERVALLGGTLEVGSPHPPLSAAALPASALPASALPASGSSGSCPGPGFRLAAALPVAPP